MCEIFEYLILKRQDSVIDNVILWFKHIQEISQCNKQIIDREIKEDLKNVIPDLFPTSISQIDEQLSEIRDSDKNIINFPNISKNKFKKKNEFQNLNDLCPKKQKFAILPSLFNLFLTSRNKDVENKSIKLITKLFSQYEDLQTQMDKLEIIFDAEESKIYVFLQDLINSAKYIIEKCEVNIFV